MSAHRLASLIANLDQEPPHSAPAATPGFVVIPATATSSLTPEQIHAAQAIHQMAYEQAMQSLTPPPANRKLFDSMN